MDEEIKAVSIDDLFAASAAGVLRALNAREQASGLDFVRSGFFVDIHIIAGGLIGPREGLPGRFGGYSMGAGEEVEQ